MYVTIDMNDYTEIRNLAFSPETDLAGNSIPINELSLDIVTTDDISLGQYVYLYDDIGKQWAKYWITYAEHEDRQTVRLRARSDIGFMDGTRLEAAMYNDAPVESVLDSTMVTDVGETGLQAEIGYTLDSSLRSQRITGYFPEQSVRERLAWICLVIGAYVKTYFNEQIEVLPLDKTDMLIPIEKTFWKPTVSYRDYVTAVRVKGYSFTEGEASTGVDSVTVDEKEYIRTEQEYTLYNPAANDAPFNIVTIDGVYIINSANAGSILARMAEFYFNRSEVELDVIDNAEYIPGDRVTVYSEPDSLLTGYITSCNFSFGVQARAKLKLTALETKASAKLTITYLYDGVQIGKNEYYFPVGYNYAISNPYIDMSMNGHRYIFRPSSDKVIGTMAAGGNSESVPYSAALDLYDDVLHIIGVDSISISGTDTAVIA